jgi:hypothetical protein
MSKAVLSTAIIETRLACWETWLILIWVFSFTFAFCGGRVQCIEIGQALRIAARLESRGTGRGGREIREWERFKDMYDENERGAERKKRGS